MKTSRIALLALAIACAAGIAYSNSFSAPFFFDDHDVIENNPTIRHLGTALFPPKADGMTVSGRPLVNLSLAVNYALGGTNLAGYHVGNLAIHIAAALVLFGVIRRTLGARDCDRWGGSNAALVGFAIAIVWVLHPLQTESVTYISQRAESIVSLCYLLTLYFFVRWSDARALRSPKGEVGSQALPGLRLAGRDAILNTKHVGGIWAALSVAACFAGMASKEVMVSAPLAVLAYDAIFGGAGFLAALKSRRVYYAALFSSWILLAVLVAGSAGRGGTAGAKAGVTTWNYALTQCGAIIHYIRLAIWPSPLVFDYGTAVVHSAGEVILPGLLLVVLVAAAIYAWVRAPRLGFAAALFFALLAPSSSIVPVATQTIAEHRMYLALAPLISIVVIRLWRVIGRGTVVLCLAWAVVLGSMTFVRNRAYANELALWSDTVRKLPSNARAHANLGKAYLVADRREEAIAEIDEALRIGPPTAEAHYNRGLIAEQGGDVELALRHFSDAVVINPRYAEAHNNLALMLEGVGRMDDALHEAEEAVRLAPDMAEPHENLGNLLGRAGRLTDALSHFVRGIELEPNNPLTHANLATALFQSGKLDDARAQLLIARDLAPDDFAVHQSLGYVLLQMKRPQEAAPELRRALELNPNLPAVRDMLQRIQP